MSLSQDAFRRRDESNDHLFYSFPRLVTHIDDAAIEFVVDIYRDLFPPDAPILDLMSSFVSHLPPEIEYARVAGLGMNRVELDANPRLTERFVQSLNENPRLPFAEAEFAAAGMCVSVQYLIQPDKVFAEINRVLQPDAPLVVSFSNRCFPTKAVAVWNALDDEGHIELVTAYFAAAGNFSPVEIRRHKPRGSDPLFAVIARKHI